MLAGRALLLLAGVLGAAEHEPTALEQAGALAGRPEASAEIAASLRRLKAAPRKQSGEPARLLSATGLYLDVLSKTVDPSNEPFEPQYALWSDGAAKKRWIRLPPGSKIDTSDMDRWVFPVGTRIWKEFSFREGGAGPLRRVETRYIEKRGPEDWVFAAYAWNKDETDAILVPAEGLKDHFPIGGGLRHDVPGLAACAACHSRGGDRVLGFDALDLSGDRDEGAPAGLDLDALIGRGLLTRAPERAPKIASGRLLARKALGYAHANCGHCHNPQGTAAFTGMFLRYRIEGTEAEEDIPAFQTAVGHRTRFFQIPGRTGTLRIKPRDPDASAVVFRMRNRGNSAQMPPLATKLQDPEGIGFMREWIEGLAPRPAPALAAAL